MGSNLISKGMVVTWSCLYYKISTHTEYNGAYNRRCIFSQQTVDEQWKEITVEVAMKNLSFTKRNTS